MAVVVVIFFVLGGDVVWMSGCGRSWAILTTWVVTSVNRACRSKISIELSIQSLRNILNVKSKAFILTWYRLAIVQAFDVYGGTRTSDKGVRGDGSAEKWGYIPDMFALLRWILHIDRAGRYRWPSCRGCVVPLNGVLGLCIVLHSAFTVLYRTPTDTNGLANGTVQLRSFEGNRQQRVRLRS